MATVSGAVRDLEAIVSLLRAVVSVTVKVVHLNSAFQQQRLIKETWLIAFHLLNRPHVFLHRRGSLLLFSPLFLLCSCCFAAFCCSTVACCAALNCAACAES